MYTNTSPADTLECKIEAAAGQPSCQRLILNLLYPNHLISSRRFLSLQECPKWHNPSPKNTPSHYKSPLVHNAEWNHAGAACVHQRKHLLLSDPGTTGQRGQAISSRSLLFRSFSAWTGSIVLGPSVPLPPQTLSWEQLRGTGIIFMLKQNESQHQKKKKKGGLDSSKGMVIMHLLYCRYSMTTKLHLLSRDSVEVQQFPTAQIIANKTRG